MKVNRSKPYKLNRERKEKDLAAKRALMLKQHSILVSFGFLLLFALLIKGVKNDYYGLALSLLSISISTFIMLYIYEAYYRDMVKENIKYKARLFLAYLIGLFCLMLVIGLLIMSASKIAGIIFIISMLIVTWQVFKILS